MGAPSPQNQNRYFRLSRINTFKLLTSANRSAFREGENGRLSSRCASIIHKVISFLLLQTVKPQWGNATITFPDLPARNSTLPANTPEEKLYRECFLDNGVLSDGDKKNRPKSGSKGPIIFHQAKSGIIGIRGDVKAGGTEATFTSNCVTQ